MASARGQTTSSVVKKKRFWERTFGKICCTLCTVCNYVVLKCFWFFFVGTSRVPSKGSTTGALCGPPFEFWTPATRRRPSSPVEMTSKNLSSSTPWLAAGLRQSQRLGRLDSGESGPQLRGVFACCPAGCPQAKLWHWSTCGFNPSEGFDKRTRCRNLTAV